LRLIRKERNSKSFMGTSWDG